MEHRGRSILRVKESLCYCVTVSTYGWRCSVAEIEAKRSSLNEYGRKKNKKAEGYIVGLHACRQGYASLINHSNEHPPPTHPESSTMHLVLHEWRQIYSLRASQRVDERVRAQSLAPLPPSPALPPHPPTNPPSVNPAVPSESVKTHLPFSLL